MPVERLDRLGGLDERPQQIRVQAVPGRVDLRGGHPDLVELDLVEAHGVLPKRRVASLPHVLDDVADLGHRSLAGKVRAGERA